MAHGNLHSILNCHALNWLLNWNNASLPQCNFTMFPTTQHVKISPHEYELRRKPMIPSSHCYVSSAPTKTVCIWISIPFLLMKTFSFSPPRVPELCPLADSPPFHMSTIVLTKTFCCCCWMSHMHNYWWWLWHAKKCPWRCLGQAFSIHPRIKWRMCFFCFASFPSENLGIEFWIRIQYNVMQGLVPLNINVFWGFFSLP